MEGGERGNLVPASPSYGTNGNGSLGHRATATPKSRQPSLPGGAWRRSITSSPAHPWPASSFLPTRRPKGGTDPGRGGRPYAVMLCSTFNKICLVDRSGTLNPGEKLNANWGVFVSFSFSLFNAKKEKKKKNRYKRFLSVLSTTALREDHLFFTETKAGHFPLASGNERQTLKMHRKYHGKTATSLLKRH